MAGTTSGPIAIDIGSITTAGDWAGAINASSTTGDVNITVKDISTIGQGSNAVTASSGSGNLTVVANGTISTAGANSYGIMASSPGGDVTVTNSGRITTTGELSSGIFAKSGTGKTIVTNSGSVNTTGAGSHAIWVNNDQGAGDITVTSTGTVTARDGSGVLVEGSDGNIVLDIASATAGGRWSRAVYASSTTGNINAKVGTASTTGEAYVVDLRTNDGDVSLVAGDLSSQDDGATGIFAANGSGRIDLNVNSITTKGSESTGIYVEANTGPVAINVSGAINTSGELLADGIDVVSQSGTVTIDTRGQIATSGRQADGISVDTDTGNVTVVARGTITTQGRSSEGIDLSSTSGDIDVLAASVFTHGVNSTGIEVESDSGAVRVVSNGSVVTEGEGSDGITASGGAGATIDAVSISTSGEDADAIRADAHTGDVRVNALDVRASGADSNGIVARSNKGSVHVTARNSRAAGGNAINASSGSGAANVTVSGIVNSGNGDAILIDGATASNVHIEATGQVSGATSAIVAKGANVTITNAGRLFGGSEPTVIATQGVATLINTGAFSGGVHFGAGDDFVANSGTFALSGASDFGGGADSFVNTGMVSLLSDATILGLERFQNAGLVTLANNRVGDVLTVSGDYIGLDGTLTLDINNTSGVLVSDQLVIGGAASGTTAIALNHQGNSTLIPGTTLKLVDAAGGSTADAFTLTPETVNAGFFHYGLRYDALGDDFLLVSSEGTALYQTLKINEGAQTLWRQSADAWSTHTAALRDPANDTEASGRFWTQIYGSNDTRDQSFTSTSGGLTRNVDVSYRQEHAGGQFGVDFGAIGSTGLTYGLTGGYLDSALKFSGTADRTDYQAFNLGAYAGGQWGPYFVNALAKYDLIKAKTHSATAGYAETLDGRAYGLQVEAGARFGDSGFFMEPVASLAYSRTDLDTLQALGSDVDFDTLDGLRSKIGARIGGNSSLAGGVATFYLGAHLVKEFEGKDGIRRVSGGTSSALANTPVDAYGQFQLGVNFASENGVTGYIEGTAATSSDYENYGGVLALSYHFSSGIPLTRPRSVMQTQGFNFLKGWCDCTSFMTVQLTKSLSAKRTCRRQRHRPVSRHFSPRLAGTPPGFLWSICGRRGGKRLVRNSRAVPQSRRHLLHCPAASRLQGRGGFRP